MSNYFQDRANKEGKPIYVGPDNINGGSHWVYPQPAKESIAEIVSFNPFDTNERWARNVVNNNPHKSGSFVLKIAHAYLSADHENQIILNDGITLLRVKYPTWDIEEKL